MTCLDDALDNILSKFASDVSQVLVDLDAQFPESTSEQRLALLEAAAARVFDRDKIILDPVAKRYASGNYQSAAALAALEKISDFVFQAAAKRFYFLVTTYRLSYADMKRGRA